MKIGFYGKIEKVENWYAIEIPELLIFSQAKTQKAALKVTNEILQETLESFGIEGFDPGLTQWVDKNKHKFRVCLPVEQSSIAFILRQIRGFKKLSLSQAAQKMGYSSKNSIAAYEKIGGKEPTLGKLSQFLDIYGIDAEIKLRA